MSHGRSSRLFFFVYGSRVRAHVRFSWCADPAVYRAVPELRTVEAITLRARPSFVKELVQVL